MKQKMIIVETAQHCIYKCKKNQINDDLQEDFERYCSTLPVFGRNNARYDINLMKSYLLPVLVNEWDIEQTVTKDCYKGQSVFPLKFGKVEHLDI